MIAGQLEIQLLANVAQLSKDIASAKSMLSVFGRDVERMASQAKAVLGTIGAGLSVGGLIAFADHINDATAKMKDLGLEAGTTAERISRFDAPARTAGSSLDAVAAAMFRVSKAAVEARDAATPAAAAMAAIGISTKDLKNLKPDEMFELIARQLDKYSDGIDKNNVMTVLFNKSGKEMNKVVHEIAQTSELAATVTNEQAEAANKLNAQLIETKMQSEAFWRNLVSAGVPALNDILKAFNSSRQEVGLWQAAINAASAAFDAFAGTPLQRYQKEMAGLRGEMQAIAEWQAEVARTGATVTDASKGEQAARYAAALARVLDLEKLISQEEIRQQDAGVKPGGGGKPDPKFDAQAAARANVYRTELAQLDAEMAKLKGVGEVEAYVAKLEEDRFKLLTAAQKTDLVNKEKEIVAYKTMLEANRMILASETALINEMQRRKEIEQDVITHAREDLEQRQFEISLIGKTAEEQERLTAMRQLDLELRKQIAALDVEDGDFQSAGQIAQIDRITKIIDLEKQRTGALIDQKNAIQAQVSVYNEMADALGHFLGDLVVNGKSAVDHFRSYLKQLLADMIAIFAKRWILNLAAGGSVGGAAADAAAFAGGGGSGSSLLGTGLSVAGNYAAGALGYTGLGTFGQFAGAASGAIPAGAIGADAVAAGVGVDTAAAGLGAGLSGVYAALAAIPVWGWIAMAVVAIGAWIAGNHKGGPKFGGSFGGTFSGAGDFLGASPIAGTQDGRLFTPNEADSELGKLVTGLGHSFGDALRTLGGTSGGVNFGLGFDSDPHGTSPDRVSSSVSDLAGNILYQNINQNTGDSLDGTLSLETQRMLLAALQASQLPKEVGDIINSLVAESATSEQITAVLHAAQEMASVIRALPDLGLNIDVAGLRAFAANGESIGQTFNRLAATIADFDNQFMTDAQKIQRAQKQVTDAFALLGVAIPADKTAFYDLVHSLDLTTEAGRAMFTALMQVAPAFLVVQNAATAAANTITDAAVQIGEAQAYILSGQADYDAVVASRELAKQLADIKASLRGWLTGLLGSNLSPLSPMEQLAAAKKEYERLLALAKGGDLDAARGLSGAGNAYLQIARQLFGSGTAYVDIFQDVFNGVAAFAGTKDYNGQMMDIQQKALEVQRQVNDTLSKMRQESNENTAYIVNQAALQTDRIVDALTTGGADRR